MTTTQTTAIPVPTVVRVCGSPIDRFHLATPSRIPGMHVLACSGRTTRNAIDVVNSVPTEGRSAWCSKCQGA